MLYLHGRALEDRLRDGLGLVSAPALPLSSPECGGLGDELFCLNFARPFHFNSILYQAADLSGAVSGLLQEVIRLYRAALGYAAGYLPAAKRLLTLFHDEGRWSEYLAEAEDVVRSQPDSGWSYLLLGLGLARSGRLEAAARAFQRALELLPASERRFFEDPERLLREREAECYVTLTGRDQAAYRAVYWRKADPLHLTPVNERRLEHLAPMVYADIRFSAPEVGLRGWDTDRGDVYVRYGPPRRIFQVRRESQKEINPALTTAATDLLKCQRVVHTVSDSIKGLSGCDFGSYLGVAGATTSEGGR